jgi:transcription elongation factor Elf1
VKKEAAMHSAELTTLDEVEAAARELGIWVDTDDGDPDGEGAVLLVAHHALWAVIHDPSSLVGWIAVRLDRNETEIAGSAGWLGVSDLEPEQIVANLLDQSELPTDLFGRGPRVPTRHPYELERPEDAYLDCPVCGRIAAAATADYILTTDGQVDLDRPVVVRCAICGQETDGRPCARIRTHEHACPRCRAYTWAPALPSRVTCTGCGLRYAPDEVKGTSTEADLFIAPQSGDRSLDARARHVGVDRAADDAHQPYPDRSSSGGAHRA